MNENQPEAKKITIWARLIGLVVVVAGLGGIVAAAIDPNAILGFVGFAAALFGIKIGWPSRFPALLEIIQQIRGVNAGGQPGGPTGALPPIPELATEVLGADCDAPKADTWNRKLRPVMFQAPTYSVPTYFLDENLFIVDWNPAFELIFGDVVSMLQGEHVNRFIATLDNAEESFDHAREFSNKNPLPTVDLEKLIFTTLRFGTFNFMKIASQMFDDEGVAVGWSVALNVRSVRRWRDFQDALLQKLSADRVWTNYARSYDRVLEQFPPYTELIEEVTDALPNRRLEVLDLGAGTGNATSHLLEADHRVWAVEKNSEMIERLRDKLGETDDLTIVKASAENLGSLPKATFDAVVSVNLLYALDDPGRCLRQLNRLLVPDGVLAFSTTHSESTITRLLSKIEAISPPELIDDVQNVRAANERLSQSGVIHRYALADYRHWLEAAGFKVTYENSTAYERAVVVIHARKVREIQTMTQARAKSA